MNNYSPDDDPAVLIGRLIESGQLPKSCWDAVTSYIAVIRLENYVNSEMCFGVTGCWPKPSEKLEKHFLFGPNTREAHILGTLELLFGMFHEQIRERHQAKRLTTAEAIEAYYEIRALLAYVERHRAPCVFVPRPSKAALSEAGIMEFSSAARILSVLEEHYFPKK